MPDTEDETNWRAEFERDGERAVHDTLHHGPGEFDGPKRQFAIRWLREKEKDREKRDRQTLCYGKMTFWAAVVAVAVGLLTWWATK